LAVGGASVLLRQTVRGPLGVCASLRIKLACVRIGGNRPARIPPRWREALAGPRHQTASDVIDAGEALDAGDHPAG
jgi:acyl-CoA thioester hydrolase